jgi:predicted enzyme related to lactoylglutathione lyase
MANSIAWFEVLGNDYDGMKRFYGDMFGWSYEEPMDGYAMTAPDGQEGLMGGIGRDPSGGGGHATFYVGVDDVQAALDKAESLGGTALMPPMEPTPGTVVALFADPEGHVVGLVKPGPPPDQQQG